jgi:putative hydrolase of the HAD superfamily
VQSFFDYAVSLGAIDDAEKRRKAARWTHYYWAQSTELAQDSDLFGEEDEPFWIHYAQRSLLAFDCSMDCAQSLAPEVQRYMREEHITEDYVPVEVPETLQRLKDANYRLGVLSNRFHSCQEYLQQVGLADYFELALVAGEVNAWKPDPEIFYQALQRMGAVPGRTIYIGDNYYADIVGAKNAALTPILVDPDEVFPDADCLVVKLISDLSQLLNL